MIRYNLLRNDLGIDCTLGTLFKFGGKTFVTLERPDKQNKRHISCIPKGVYKVVRHHSEQFPNTWRLLDVPDREGILIHAGNWVQDTTGCILIGMDYGSKTRIANSRKALDAFNKELEGVEEFHIDIS